MRNGPTAIETMSSTAWCMAKQPISPRPSYTVKTGRGTGRANPMNGNSPTQRHQSDVERRVRDGEDTVAGVMGHLLEAAVLAGDEGGDLVLADALLHRPSGLAGDAAGDVPKLVVADEMEVAVLEHLVLAFCSVRSCSYT